MTTTDKFRQKWVTAVLQRHFATADFLAAHLPAASERDMIHPPNDVKDLECWAVAGEIADHEETPLYAPSPLPPAHTVPEPTPEPPPNPRGATAIEFYL